MSYTIHCEPYQKNIEAQKGVTVHEAIRLHLPAADTPCAGHGRCGKCVIKLLEGTLSPITETEKEHLSEQMLKDGLRLACQSEVLSDISIQLPQIPSDLSGNDPMLKLPDDFRPMPETRKYHIAPQSRGKRAAVVSLDSIRQSTGLHSLEFTADALCSLQDALDKGGKDGITLVVNENTAITAEAGNTTDKCYGIAFDIGTTTIAAVLCNLITGEILSTEATANSQSAYGADIVSRIEFCQSEPNGAEIMKKLAVSDMNRLVDILIKRCSAERGSIYRAAVVGNTVMCHFVLGINPVGLSAAPFVPLFHDEIQVSAEKLSLEINRSGAIYILPGIAGFIGSDISAVAAAADIFALRGVTVIADIGTNGEILAAKDGKVYACSTAAGPAFEGACIKNGMRASQGAIRSVKFDDDVQLDVTGNSEPSGICGSGLIDIIAELLRYGLISKAGALISEEEAAEKGIPKKISCRLFRENGENGFSLYDRADGQRVAIYQKDIREIQLAKAAISSGIKTLLNKLNADADSIERIILSGAFGSFINAESGMTIGLIPKLSADRIVSIGNGAGIGAVMGLLSSEVRKKTELETKLIQHIDLSQSGDFYKIYSGELFFPS